MKGTMLSMLEIWRCSFPLIASLVTLLLPLKPLPLLITASLLVAQSTQPHQLGHWILLTVKELFKCVEEHVSTILIDTKLQQKICLSTIRPGISNQLTDIFPSIYTQWSIQVDGYQRSVVPHPVTSAEVKIAITICKLGPQSSIKRDLKESDIDGRSCCINNLYWSDNSCKPCPSGSKSALYGYFVIVGD